MTKIEKLLVELVGVLDLLKDLEAKRLSKVQNGEKDLSLLDNEIKTLNKAKSLIKIFEKKNQELYESLFKKFRSRERVLFFYNVLNEVINLINQNDPESLQNAIAVRFQAPKDPHVSQNLNRKFGSLLKASAYFVGFCILFGIGAPRAWGGHFNVKSWDFEKDNQRRIERLKAMGKEDPYSKEVREIADKILGEKSKDELKQEVKREERKDISGGLEPTPLSPFAKVKDKNQELKAKVSDVETALNVAKAGDEGVSGAIIGELSPEMNTLKRKIVAQLMQGGMDLLTLEFQSYVYSPGSVDKILKNIGYRKGWGLVDFQRAVGLKVSSAISIYKSNNSQKLKWDFLRVCGFNDDDVNKEVQAQIGKIKDDTLELIHNANNEGKSFEEVASVSSRALDSLKSISDGAGKLDNLTNIILNAAVREIMNKYEYIKVQRDKEEKEGSDNDAGKTISSDINLFKTKLITQMDYLLGSGSVSEPMNIVLPYSIVEKIMHNKNISSKEDAIEFLDVFIPENEKMQCNNFLGEFLKGCDISIDDYVNTLRTESEGFVDRAFKIINDFVNVENSDKVVKAEVAVNFLIGKISSLNVVASNCLSAFQFQILDMKPTIENIKMELKQAKDKLFLQKKQLTGDDLLRNWK